MLTKQVEHVFAKKRGLSIFLARKRPVKNFWRGKNPGKDENTLCQPYLYIGPWSLLFGHEKSLVNLSIDLTCIKSVVEEGV